MEKLKGLEPNRVFHYFEEISKIPRGSYDEKRISDYLKGVGERLGLETIQDDLLNIIIRKPASPGYENSEGVIIQGHMDMVCEKSEDSDHDFTKDPIDLIVDGDFIRANETTLGADNGIAIAMGLAILEDQTLEHPPIELLVTTSEETEMDGALGLSENLLTGTRLLNIDSEEEGVLVTGSAGGELVRINLKSSKEALEGFTSVSIEVKGLMGGHSGMEIDKPRGNANKIMNTILKGLKSTMMDIRLVSINGGSKDNAIPRQTAATIAVKTADMDIFNSKMEELKAAAIRENKEKESGIEVLYTIGGEAKEAFSVDTLDKIVTLLGDIHTGVFSMIPQNTDIVESSCNLAIVKTQEDSITVQVSIRSSAEKKMEELREKILAVVRGVNAEYSIGGGYPGWEFRPESNLRDTAMAVYKDTTGKDMHATVIHAGLECGVLSKKYPVLDIISFGPNMYDVHTPQERLNISSTERIYAYTVELLKRLK